MRLREVTLHLREVTLHLRGMSSPFVGSGVAGTGYEENTTIDALPALTPDT
jgi:hypothetical protein